MIKNRKSKILLSSLYERGAVSIEQLMQYVEDGSINEDEFFNITRMYYWALKQTKEKQKNKGDIL